MFRKGERILKDYIRVSVENNKIYQAMEDIPNSTTDPALVTIIGRWTEVENI